jgi:5'-nucleotidase
MSIGSRRHRRIALLLGAALTLGIALPAGARTPPAGPLLDIQLLAFNDYHGHLESSTPGSVGSVAAGGSEYLASHLARLREGNRNSLTVAAGDLIGGTPFLSGLFRDEPSVDSLNAMGLDVSSVGNHEFDDGVTELLRMQNGGCHPEDGCYFPDEPYAGADFPWLAANVVNDTTGKTVLPPYWIKKFQGARIAFIGMTLEATPSLVSPSGIEGWSFKDEAETANALVPVLKRQGVEAIVVLLHEGLDQAGGSDECVNASGPVLQIQAELDPEIDLMITGHTHRPYNCVLTDPDGNPRRVTSAFSFGRIISEINLKIDRRTGDIRRDLVEATNHVVDRTSVTPDPLQTAIISKYRAVSDVIGARPVGEITADILRGKTASGSEERGIESAAGNMIADAQLWATEATNGAEIGLINPGGVRADLLYAQAKGEGDGVVTYEEAFNVLPFGNLVSTIPMTGAQIISVLKEQCQPIGSGRPFLHMGVSAGFTYDLQKTIVNTPLPNGTTRRDCTSVTVSNVKLNGVALDPGLPYLVTANNFLLDGGDNFVTFKQIPASERLGAGEDLQQLIDYLGSEGPVAPPATDRVNELP